MTIYDVTWWFLTPATPKVWLHCIIYRFCYVCAFSNRSPNSVSQWNSKQVLGNIWGVLWQKQISKASLNWFHRTISVERNYLSLSLISSPGTWLLTCATVEIARYLEWSRMIAWHHQAIWLRENTFYLRLSNVSANERRQIPDQVEILMYTSSTRALINSLWPYAVIWWHRSGSTLDK